MRLTLVLLAALSLPSLLNAQQTTTDLESVLRTYSEWAREQEKDNVTLQCRGVLERTMVTPARTESTSEHAVFDVAFNEVKRPGLVKSSIPLLFNSGGPRSCNFSKISISCTEDKKIRTKIADIPESLRIPGVRDYDDAERVSIDLDRRTGTLQVSVTTLKTSIDETAVYRRSHERGSFQCERRVGTQF